MWLSRLLVAVILFALCSPAEAQEEKKVPRGIAGKSCHVAAYVHSNVSSRVPPTLLSLVCLPASIDSDFQRLLFVAYPFR